MIFVSLLVILRLSLGQKIVTHPEDTPMEKPELVMKAFLRI
jgi:hypothetical protein